MLAMIRICLRRYRLNRLLSILFLSQCLVFLLLTGLKLSKNDDRATMNAKTRNFKHNDGKCRTFTNSSECLDGKSDSDQIKTDTEKENEKQSTDQLQRYLNEIPDITLNPKTEKSLNPKSVSDLTEMLHVSVKKPYLIENSELCSSVEDLKVVVVVHSAPNNFEKRNVIRETWTNTSYYPNLGNVRTLFVLGRSKSSVTTAQIKQEFETYGDILQGDFIDSYHNITVKGVILYKWLTERCRNADTILKVDDDVIIDMFYFLTKHVSVILTKSDHISCRLLTYTHIRRSKIDRWYVGPNQFVKDRSYPPFCQGFMAAFNNDVIPKLFKSALVTPFFWIDDIYLYGLVPGNLETFKYNNLEYGKTVTWGAEGVIECFKKRYNCNFFVVLIWTDIPNKMRQIWSLYVQRYQSTFLR